MLSEMPLAAAQPSSQWCSASRRSHISTPRLECWCCTCPRWRRSCLPYGRHRRSRSSCTYRKVSIDSLYCGCLRSCHLLSSVCGLSGKYLPNRVMRGPVKNSIWGVGRLFGLSLIPTQRGRSWTALSCSFLASLLDWPIILTAGLGTWFWGRSWATIIAFCVMAAVTQATIAYAHITLPFQPILLADRLRRCPCLGLRRSGCAYSRSARQ